VPYPTDGSGQVRGARGARPPVGPRSSKATPVIRESGDPRNAIERRTQVRRWSVIGVLAGVLVVGYFLMGSERTAPVGVAGPVAIALPSTQTEASNILSTVNAAAQLEVRNGELIVRIATAMFPERPEGQLALARRYTRADEIIQGRKRAISFVDPNGSVFAKADPVQGVALTR
jgi:hypothetical protein